MNPPQVLYVVVRRETLAARLALTAAESVGKSWRQIADDQRDAFMGYANQCLNNLMAGKKAARFDDDGVPFVVARRAALERGMAMWCAFAPVAQHCEPGTAADMARSCWHKLTKSERKRFTVRAHEDVTELVLKRRGGAYEYRDAFKGDA